MSSCATTLTRYGNINAPWELEVAKIQVSTITKKNDEVVVFVGKQNTKIKNGIVYRKTIVNKQLEIDKSKKMSKGISWIGGVAVHNVSMNDGQQYTCLSYHVMNDKIILRDIDLPP